MCRLAMLSVHTCPLAPLGGKETGGMNVYIRELALALGQRSMTVDVFTRRSDPTIPAIVPFGPRARVIHLPSGPEAAIDRNAILPFLPEFVHRVHDFAATHQLDYRLVHSHYWLSAWAGTALSDRWKIPHAVMYHTLGQVKNNARQAENESPQRIAIERRTMARADAIIAASEDERLQMVTLYGAAAERVNLIPCGVNLDLFRPIGQAVARRRIGFEGRRLIVFVGRMQPLKGADLLLESLARLDGRHDYHLLLIGGSLEGDLELRRLRDLAHRLALTERVTFLGAQSHERLPLYYSAADVCVVPSYYESFGLVAMEALACGTPVIASRVGGLPTVVRNGENGILVAWRTPDLFAHSIDTLLTDEDLRDRLARCARPSIERFNWQSVADEVLTVYDNLAIARPMAQSCLCYR